MMISKSIKMTTSNGYADWLGSKGLMNPIDIIKKTS